MLNERVVVNVLCLVTDGKSVDACLCSAATKRNTCAVACEAVGEGNAAMVEMAEAIIKDQKRILPSIAYLEGEYGYNDLCLGVPTLLGANGIEKIFELELTDKEKAALDVSAEAVRNVMKALS